MKESTKEKLQTAALFIIPALLITIIFVTGRALEIKEFIEWSK